MVDCQKTIYFSMIAYMNINVNSRLPPVDEFRTFDWAKVRQELYDFNFPNNFLHLAFMGSKP